MKTVKARFPWALYLPLAALTAGPGLLIVWSGYSIGWSAVLAPLVGLMRGAIRPRFELTEDGSDQSMPTKHFRRQSGAIPSGVESHLVV